MAGPEIRYKGEDILANNLKSYLADVEATGVVGGVVVGRRQEEVHIWDILRADSSLQPDLPFQFARLNLLNWKLDHLLSDLMPVRILTAGHSGLGDIITSCRSQGIDQITINLFHSMDTP